MKTPATAFIPCLASTVPDALPRNALPPQPRPPLHLFADEADDACPQWPFGGEAAMVGAMEDVVMRGRKKGIGYTLVTQRPADLAKQVMTPCVVLVSMRRTHPRDIAAIREWVNVHADLDEAAEMIASLPSLPADEAWFWSPG